MKATFKVTFLIQRTKLKANGKAPIVTRIIVNGEMAHFSTQQEIEPDRWDPRGIELLVRQMMKKPSTHSLMRSRHP